MRTWNEYVRDERINQSRLKQILHSRWAYDNHYIDNHDTDDDPKIYSDDSLVYGHLIEDMVANLTIDEDKFLTVEPDFKFPTEKAASAAHRYLESSGIKDEEERKLQAMQDWWSHIKDKKKRVKKFDEYCTDYIEFLRDSSAMDKMVITRAQNDLAREQIQKLYYDEVKKARFVKEDGVDFIRKLRYGNDRIKMEIDSLRVDHKLKLIAVQDIKTCMNSARSFRKNFWRFRYDFQLGFYAFFIGEWCNEHYPDYTLDSHVDFLVISNASPEPPRWYSHEWSKGYGDYEHQGLKVRGVSTAFDLLHRSKEDESPYEMVLDNIKR